MSGQPEQSEQSETAVSYILIRFAEPGSAIFDVNFHNVIPSQVLATVAYLELRGKNAMLQYENERLQREAEQQLAVPKPSILRPGQ